MPRTAGEPDTAWSVIIAVKDTLLAKTRLSGFHQGQRAILARAFALDVVTAALDCASVARVVVVTNDDQVATAVQSIGAAVVPDRPNRGLNAAFAYGAERARHLDGNAGVVALQADLPALRTEDLDAAFRLAGQQPSWLVADTEGVGTTLLAQRPGRDLRPAFGPNSRVAHLALGATEILGPELARLRRDVDIEEHLWAVLSLGVGAETNAALTQLDLVPAPRP